MYNIQGPFTLPVSISAAPGQTVKGIDLTDTAGDVAVFAIPFKCEFYRAACLVRSNVTGATAAKGHLKFDHRPTAGMDVSRTDGDCGNFVLKGIGSGSFVYFDLASGSSAITLNEGDEVVVQLAVKASAGVVQPVLLVNYIPEVPGNNTNMVAATIG